MAERKILVPTDLTDVSQVAIDYAIMIAKQAKAGITLLHIHIDKSWSVFAIENKLRTMSEKIGRAGITADFKIREGNIFKEIPEEACEKCYFMSVITTHGIRGFKQKLMGADILKLVKEIAVPVLVVQESSKIQSGGFKNIVFPVGGHASFKHKISGTLLLAGLYDPEIHLYSITRPGFEATEQLKENVKLAISSFDSRGLDLKRVEEEPSVYSVGYAKQTLQYAEKCGADLIAIMSVPTPEYNFFAQADKETLLTNDQGIPVLCTSDKELI